MNYRIQQRKYSSNILERSIDGKHWKAFIAPLINKDEGDLIVEGLLKIYTTIPPKSKDEWFKLFRAQTECGIHEPNTNCEQCDDEATRMVNVVLNL